MNEPRQIRLWRKGGRTGRSIFHTPGGCTATGFEKSTPSNNGVELTKAASDGASQLNSVFGGRL